MVQLDCPKMEKTEQDALGSKGWSAAVVLPSTGLLLQAKPEVKAGELPQLQLIRGWML